MRKTTIVNEANRPHLVASTKEAPPHTTPHPPPNTNPPPPLLLITRARTSLRVKAALRRKVVRVTRVVRIIRVRARVRVRTIRVRVRVRVRIIRVAVLRRTTNHRVPVPTIRARPITNRPASQAPRIIHPVNHPARTNLPRNLRPVLRITRARTETRNDPATMIDTAVAARRPRKRKSEEETRNQFNTPEADTIRKVIPMLVSFFVTMAAPEL
uniref:Uncharacterized protein n=1 Tax=Cacopsylla melanoneura TaxID=428564 RepID=A0A8D8PWQ7_9HEMI